MQDYLKKRVLDEGAFVVENNSTVRATAKIFSVSKSTVHKDLSERLKGLDKYLYDKVKKVLERNLNERHIRGGLATKMKYKGK